MDAVPLPGEGIRRRTEPIAGPWTSFFVAVQFLLLFPLLPLGAELLFTGKVTISSLTLVTATYAISLATASRNLLFWASSFMFGVIFSALFGWASAPGNRFDPVYRLDAGPLAGRGALWGPLVVIVGLFAVHLCERFIRHVQKKELFPEFLNQ